MTDCVPVDTPFEAGKRFDRFKQGRKPPIRHCSGDHRIPGIYHDLYLARFARCSGSTESVFSLPIANSRQANLAFCEKNAGLGYGEIRGNRRNRFGGLLFRRLGLVTW